VSSPRPRRPSPRRRRRRRLARLLGAAGIAAVFLVGIALGEALHDSPKTGAQTLVRTLRPLSLAPIVQSTVTVTTVAPAP